MSVTLRRVLPLLAACLALMMLPGCASYRARPRVDLPPMPAGVRQPCAHPAIRAGEDPLVPLARYIAALRACEGRRADAVAFYDDLREGLR